MGERREERGPWFARMAGGILSERGLGTLISIVLVVAMIWFGIRIVNDFRDFQTQMIAESVRTNEKLEQLAVNHLEMKLAMDRLERLLLAKSGTTP